MSHAVGVGQPLPEETVRAMMLIRANTLAKGYSGICLETLQALLNLLNRGVHPVVPAQGSVGASGDLAPLAHMSLVLIGMGEAMYQGKRVNADEALRQSGLAPIVLEAKESLALINGTSLMTAIGCLAADRAQRLVQTADVTAALSLEALHGTPRAFDARLHAVRPPPRAGERAGVRRRLPRGGGRRHYGRRSQRSRERGLEVDRRQCGQAYP